MYLEVQLLQNGYYSLFATSISFNLIYGFSYLRFNLDTPKSTQP